MAKIKHLESKFTIARIDLVEACDAEELRFYLWIKMWAINKHEAWPGLTKIENGLGMGHSSVVRLIQRLEKKGRLGISRKGNVNNVYDLTWYDRINERGSPSPILLGGSPSKILHSPSEILGGSPSTDYKRRESKNDEEKTNSNEVAASAAWSWPEKLSEIQTSGKPEAKIIALLWHKQGASFDTAAQYTVSFKRHLRAAYPLRAYPLERIGEVMDFIARQEYITQWSLETVLKYIDRPLSKPVTSDDYNSGERRVNGRLVGRWDGKKWKSIKPDDLVAFGNINRKHDGKN